MNDTGGQTFWDHLDALRDSILRIISAVMIAGVAAFCLKEQLFDIILAPKSSDFITYRLLGTEQFDIHLINTVLAEQFMTHMKVAVAAGLLCASPYILYVLFKFISPALYDNERRVSVRLVVSAYAMFIIGAAVNYFMIFPLTVRYLGTYQVSGDIDNMLTLSSYIDTLMMMTCVFGIVFEIPVVCRLLARFGMLRARWMRLYRRHAIVAILTVSAIITPSADIFTLLIVSMPIWLLYEASIYIVRMTEKHVTNEQDISKNEQDTITNEQDTITNEQDTIKNE